jgi:hypothetical protein
MPRENIWRVSGIHSHSQHSCLYIVINIKLMFLNSITFKHKSLKSVKQINILGEMKQTRSEIPCRVFITL